MEIIHLILGKANPERMNGVNKVVYQLASKQAEAGKKVAVWGITNDTTINYGKRNFTTRLFESGSNPFAFSQLLKIAVLSKKNKAVFHLHGGWIPVYFGIAKMLSKAQIPFVITPHGAYNLLAMEKSYWIKKIYFQLFEKSILNRAKKIHCIGDSEIAGLKSFYKTQKTSLIPYGFEVAMNSDKSRVKASEFVVGFVGRLDIKTKGLDLLLNAFSRFENTKNVKLWIIGDSEERAKLEKMISKKNIKHIELMGSKFGLEKISLMNQMDIFVHPSRNEGLPASILEAASLQIPCIVSKATNLYPLVSEYKAGKAIDDENEDQLFEAMKELHKDYLSDRLSIKGTAALKMVTEVFNWNKIIPQLDELYS